MWKKCCSWTYSQDILKSDAMARWRGGVEGIYCIYNCNTFRAFFTNLFSAPGSSPGHIWVEPVGLLNANRPHPWEICAFNYNSTDFSSNLTLRGSAMVKLGHTAPKKIPKCLVINARSFVAVAAPAIYTYLHNEYIHTYLRTYRCLRVFI